MRNRFTLLFIALVPLFGLISCNRNPLERPAIEDPWRLPSPQLVRPDAGRLRFFEDPTADLPAVPADSEIVFPESEALQGAKFEIQTSCWTSDGPHESQTILKAVSRIPISSLLPTGLLHTLDLDSLGGAICQIQIRGRNRIGSTHSLSLPKFMLTEVRKLESLRFQNAGEDRYVMPADTVKEQRLLPSLNGLQRLEAALFCEYFRNRREWSDEIPDESRVLEELINGEIEPAPSAFTEVRTSFTRQNCRLIMRSIDRSTNRPQTHVTPVFEIRFQPAPTSIRSFVGFDYERVGSDRIMLLANMKFIEIEVTNQAKVPLAFQIPKTDVLFQAVTSSIHGTNYTKAFRSALSIHAQGVSRQWRTDENLVFEIQPGATARIEGRFDTNFSCLVFGLSTADINTLPNKSVFVGFAYSSSVPLTLRQFDNWNPDLPQLTGSTSERMDFVPTSDIRDEFGMFLGWSPAPGWMQWTGDEAKPSAQEMPWGSELLCTHKPITWNGY